MSLWGELDRYPWLDAQPLAGSQLSTNGSFDSLSLSIAANSDRYILARLAWSQILPKYVSNCMQRAQSASGQSVEAIRTGNMYRLPVAAEILKEGVSDDTRACKRARPFWETRCQLQTARIQLQFLASFQVDLRDTTILTYCQFSRNYCLKLGLRRFI